MNLYIVRHGQTEWNYENRVCGITEVQLTNRGIEQAKELSKTIIGKQIDIIISSPLSRALKTAEIISNVISKEIIIDNRLIEQNYGVFEGVNRDSEDFKEAKKHFPNRLFGGESLLQVAQRTFNLLDEIKGKFRNQNVLIVTHGGVCRIINAYFNDQMNGEFYKFHLGNCEMKEYQFNE
ncbi:histidine phosphatase family protein [Paenibacillus apii]|uniref:histidine phosphatase family protein n=1 Tax=Paenibacillus apii TaxID=1850370 RepID=UPI00143B8058|nr:histidine phosphatase family protein [Paenibacillus apii]NJJ40485.1 histidine phosphatase family protein [Paenibacillus apii]